MFDRSDKNFGPIEVAAGILVGTLAMGLIDMVINDQTWNEVFENDKLLMGACGIAASFFFYVRQKRKSTESEEE